jgi:serine/threonine protein kinase
MEFLGIPGVRPIALLEKRWGPLSFTAYFVAESVQGPDARAYFKETVPRDKDLQKMAQIVVALKSQRIAHGDLKDTNFLMSDKGPVLIDLDSMRQYSSESVFRRAARKDRQRFLQNFIDQPEWLGRFQEIFTQIENIPTKVNNQLK